MKCSSGFFLSLLYKDFYENISSAVIGITASGDSLSSVLKPDFCFVSSRATDVVARQVSSQGGSMSFWMKNTDRRVGESRLTELHTLTVVI